LSSSFEEVCHRYWTTSNMSFQVSSISRICIPPTGRHKTRVTSTVKRTRMSSHLLRHFDKVVFFILKRTFFLPAGLQKVTPTTTCWQTRTNACAFALFFGIRNHVSSPCWFIQACEGSVGNVVSGRSVKLFLNISFVIEFTSLLLRRGLGVNYSEWSSLPIMMTSLHMYARVNVTKVHCDPLRLCYLPTWLGS